MAGFTPHPWSRRSRRRTLLITAMTAVLVAGGAAVEAEPAAAATVDPTAYYVLVNRHSGKALDVYNSSTADGADVVRWTDRNGANQQWQHQRGSAAGHQPDRLRRRGLAVRLLIRRAEASAEGEFVMPEPRRRWTGLANLTKAGEA